MVQTNGASFTRPSGYLDIHGHFTPPLTAAEAEQYAEALRSVCFMVKKPISWNAETVLDYNDRVGVRMQMLSYVPQDHEKLRAANDYGAEMVRKYPSRFGLLAALPTDNAEVCLAEIRRVTDSSELGGIVADGFATNTTYKGVDLGDTILEPVWEELNKRQAVVHIHPYATAPAAQGRPSALIEVAFQTCRTVVDMLYKGIFRRWPDIKFVLAHCGGSLPVLSSRLSLLGTEAWVPNPNSITRDEIEEYLRRLYVDTAATAKSGLSPAAKMVGAEHCIYGADCGVPCSTELTMEENKRDVEQFERDNGIKVGTIAGNGWDLFPAAVQRSRGAK